jgi:hypothetical protein
MKRRPLGRRQRELLEFLKQQLMAEGSWDTEEIEEALNKLTGRKKKKRKGVVKLQEYADYYDVCRQTAASWVRQGKVKPIVLPNGQKRYRLEDLNTEDNS